MLYGRNARRLTAAAQALVALTLLAMLVASPPLMAQGVSVTHSDPAGLSLTAETCGSDRAAPQDRIVACTRVIKAGGLPARDLANTYIYRARANRLARDAAAAERDLDLAVKSDERYGIAVFERGNFRADNGDRARALEDYDRAIRLKSTQPEFFLNRGNVHKALGHTEQAVQDYGRAIELEPGHALAFFKRGNVHLDLRELEPAARDYSEAIRLDPSNAVALYNRSLVYRELGKRDLAAQDRTRALQLDPALAKDRRRPAPR